MGRGPKRTDSYDHNGYRFIELLHTHCASYASSVAPTEQIASSGPHPTHHQLLHSVSSCVLGVASTCIHTFFTVPPFGFGLARGGGGNRHAVVASPSLNSGRVDIFVGGISCSFPALRIQYTIYDLLLFTKSGNNAVGTCWSTFLFLDLSCYRGLCAVYYMDVYGVALGPTVSIQRLVANCYRGRIFFGVPELSRNRAKSFEYFSNDIQLIAPRNAPNISQGFLTFWSHGISHQEVVDGILHRICKGLKNLVEGSGSSINKVGL